MYVIDRSTIAGEAIRRIGDLYDIERQVRGQAPEFRYSARHEQAVPRLQALRAWLDAMFRTVSSKSPIAGALHYTLVRWTALTRFAEDGRIELGRVSDWRGGHTLRGVAVVRQSRCLSPRRVSRFQSLLVEPDVQISRIRLSRRSLRPSLSSQPHGYQEAYVGRESHTDTRSGTDDTRCLASLAVGSAIVADGSRCIHGSLGMHR